MHFCQLQTWPHICSGLRCVCVWSRTCCVWVLNLSVLRKGAASVVLAQGPGGYTLLDFGGLLSQLWARREDSLCMVCQFSKIRETPATRNFRCAKYVIFCAAQSVSMRCESIISMSCQFFRFLLSQKYVGYRKTSLLRKTLFLAERIKSTRKQCQLQEEVEQLDEHS